MSNTITIQEAQTNLPELIHNLPAGRELMITENDQVIARITREEVSSVARPGPGLCQDMISIVADDEEHLKDFAEYMP